MRRKGKRKRCEGERGGGVGGGEGTLVLSVHHPEPSVREEAVREIGRVLKHKNRVCL